MMTFEERVRKHKEISHQIDELEAQRKALGESILKEMNEKTMKVGFYVVRHCSRLSIASSLEQARYFQAIKLEEVVDKEKLKELHRSGVQVPGIKEIEYIQITEKLH